MATLDEYYRILQDEDDSLMDAPGPTYGREQDLISGGDLPFNELTPAGKADVIQPAVSYHNAMNNVYMSGPAREGRSTIVTDKVEQNVFPYGTMFPTFPDVPKTEDYDVNYYPGEFNQINAAFRDATGISNDQSQARLDAGRDPNMIPGFKLIPSPQDFAVINNAAGAPAMPVDVRGTDVRGLFSDNHQTGILDDLKAFAGIFK